MNLNSHVYSTDKSESKSIHEMNISVNTNEVKYSKDEVPTVMDIGVIKVPGYFKLCNFHKEFFNNLYTAYECACMASVKEKYWSVFHHIIKNYNDRNDTPSSNVRI